VFLPTTTLDIIVHRLNLTIVPFTNEHWKEAIKVYEKDLKLEVTERPRLGRCLSAGVAARLGAPLLVPPRS
jgi:hypothetical protein